jgi:hypothetical protein
VKCADISDDVFLAAVADTPPVWPGSCWRMRQDVRVTLEQALGHEVPEKLFLAKARKLGQKRKLEGCTDCSCRGDYHLPRECRLHGCCYNGDDFDWRTHPAYDPSWEDDRLFESARPDLLDAVMETARQLGLG